MKKLACLGFAIFLASSLSLASAKAGKGGEKTFTGEISDKMCGTKHMMEGGAKDCTLKCVDGGSKFVLADTANNKVYDLSEVKVTGTLKGDRIEVSSIEAAE
jgi:type 1 fimbria pilin